MRRMLVWIKLMCKRLLLRPSFVLILCLLPVVLLSYRYILSEDSDTLRVAILVKGDDALARETADELLASETFATFYEVKDEENLYNEVASAKAECGYILEGDLEKAFLTKDYESVITVVSSDNTQYKALVNEDVYCALYRCLADDVTVNLILEHEKELVEDDSDYVPLGEEGIRELLTERYAARTESIFEYYYLDRNATGDLHFNTAENAHTENYLTRPIRGTIALFVLLAGLAGLVFWFQDDAEGRFNAFPYYRRPTLYLGSMALPVILAGICGFICLFVSGIGGNPFKEMLLMLFYVVLVTGFCNLLRLFVPSVNAACAMIPILTIASYICAPVLIDLSGLFPMVRYIRTLLVVDYYLQAALDRTRILVLIVTSIIVLAGTVALDYTGRFQRKLR